MKEMKVLGQKVEITDARVSYNEYRRLFQNEANKVVNVFRERYSKFQSADEMIELTPNTIKACMKPSIQLCIKILVDYKVLTIDAEQFESRYQEIQDIWSEAFLVVYDKYAEIVMNEEQLDRYRVARRQCRGRVVGGGFGLSGFAKGAATAGAINMVAGAGHMVFNGIGKVFSSISASMAKDKLFSDKANYETIAKGVWNATFALHWAVIEYLNESGVDTVSICGAVSSEDSRQATAILGNIIWCVWGLFWVPLSQFCIFIPTMAISYEVLVDFFGFLSDGHYASVDDIAHHRKAAQEVFYPSPVEEIPLRRADDPAVFLEVMKRLMEKHATKIVALNEDYPTKGAKPLGAWRSIGDDVYLVLLEAVFAREYAKICKSMDELDCQMFDRKDWVLRLQRCLFEGGLIKATKSNPRYRFKLLVTKEKDQTYVVAVPRTLLEANESGQNPGQIGDCAESAFASDLVLKGGDIL